MIAALRTVYATDKATFKRWATDGGRLPFPGWETTKKAVDATCWGVWSFEKLEPREVTFAELETVVKSLAFSPKVLALRLALTDSFARDFSHLTVVDGDAEQFKAVVDKPTVAQPPVFLAVTELKLSDAGDDALLRRLSKGLPNLQTLAQLRLGNVTDAGVSSLSSCANLQTLEIWRCGAVSDSALAKISGVKGLRSLSLNWCGGFTSAGIAALGAALGAASNLRSLEFWKSVVAGRFDGAVVCVARDSARDLRRRGLRRGVAGSG